MNSFRVAIFALAGFTVTTLGLFGVADNSLLAKSQITSQNHSRQMVATSTDLTQFRQEILDKHNQVRKLHDAPPMKLTDKLNQYAQEWAERLAQTGQLEHRESNKYGENLYYGWSSDPKFDVSAGVPVQAWYDEIKDYNFNKPGFSPKTGHFTQVLWVKSTELGCGKAKSKDKKFLSFATTILRATSRGSMTQMFAQRNK
jgi:uncharacterized protein YkwD